MKLKWLFIIFFVCQFFLAKSQTEIGLKSGISTFTRIGVFDLEDLEKAKYLFKTGLFFSASVRFQIKKKLILQTELNYIQKGYQFNANPNNTPGGFDPSRFKITYHFIEVPVILKYDWRIKDKSGIELGAGLGIGRTVGKMRQKITYNDTGEVDIRKYPNSATVVVDGEYQSVRYLGLDLDILIDLAYRYRINSKYSITLGTRGQLDFINRFHYTKEQLEARRASEYKNKNVGMIFYTGIIYKLNYKKGATE